MRLRSPQLVFLLLLVCSVQSRDLYALRFLTGAVSEPAHTEPHQSQTRSVAARSTLPAGLPIRPFALKTHLDPGARAVHRTAWSMRRPALASAAVSSFTSFLRA